MVLAIVILAAFFRFDGITHTGIRFEDESWYVSDARLWHRCARLLTDGAAVDAVLSTDKKAFQARMDALGVDFADRYVKPCQGYTMPGALMMFLFGDGPEALLVLNALAGLASVLVLYAIAALLFGRPIALLAALLLAISPYHIVYCRTAMADTVTTFFVLLGVLAWTAGHTKRLAARPAYLLAGLALGYALTCHIRAGYVPPVLLAVDAWIHRASLRSTARRWCWFASGCVVPTLAIESLFLLAHLAAFITDSYLPLSTFIQSIWFKIGHNVEATMPTGSSWFNPAVPAAYLRYFIHWHGVVALLLGGIGLVVAIKRRGVSVAIPALIIAPIALLSLQQCIVARAPSPSVPFACLLIAVGIYCLWDNVHQRARRRLPVLAGLIIVLVMMPPTVHAWQLRGKRSAIEEACQLIASQGGGAVLTSPRHKYELYLDGRDVDVISAPPAREMEPPAAAVRRLHEKGIRWVVADSLYWGRGSRSDYCRWWRALDQELLRQGLLTAEYRHISNYRWEFLTETAGEEHVTAMVAQQGGALRVYDLRGLMPSTDSIAASRPPDQAKDTARIDR